MVEDFFNLIHPKLNSHPNHFFKQINLKIVFLVRGLKLGIVGGLSLAWFCWTVFLKIKYLLVCFFRYFFFL